jgi:predicted GH43/DUF377 family glycosyl hydrolase
MQRWKRLGLLFNPLHYSSPKWMNSHAAVPFIEKIENKDSLKIYFSSRTKDNKSLTGWAKFSLSNLLGGPVEISKKPLLEIGKTGMFDEDGIMGCHITKINGKKYFNYIGWNLGYSTPFRNAIGLAELNEEDNIFKRISQGPILDRSIYDNCFVASNCVFDDDGIYRMYYLSCDKWEKIKGKISHKYNIKYAESKDGINWERRGIIAIDYKYDNEYAISVPRVIKENDIYKMWYSYRGGPKSEFYSIGYAESDDAINWKRKDNLINFSKSEANDWDFNMKCYPFIFDYENERYMLYNGNGYGKTGFGLAILEK